MLTVLALEAVIAVVMAVEVMVEEVTAAAVMVVVTENNNINEIFDLITPMI